MLNCTFRTPCSISTTDCDLRNEKTELATFSGLGRRRGRGRGRANGDSARTVNKVRIGDRFCQERIVAKLAPVVANGGMIDLSLTRGLQRKNT